MVHNGIMFSYARSLVGLDVTEAQFRALRGLIWL